MRDRAIANTNGKWVIPENIDVTNFDLNWRPFMYDRLYNHEFGTQWQKTGGPRYCVPGATDTKYVSDQVAKALPINKNWKILHNNVDLQSFDFSWHPDNTESGFQYVFVNKNCSYPAIAWSVDSTHQVKYCYDQEVKFLHPLSSDITVDVKFISNGEIGAADRYDLLDSYIQSEWIKNIAGRENAIKEAARRSTTEWFLLVPAKLRIDKNFIDFIKCWYPNSALGERHYVFHAKNPVNNLCYGHMAAVVYNRKLVLETIEYGLDFTMSKPYAEVPIICGTAEYNSDPLITWRTAFREVIKLKTCNDDISVERLHTWLTVGNGLNSEYSMLGAKHAVEYYSEVCGDPKALQFSFNWEWLHNKFKAVV